LWQNYGGSRVSQDFCHKLWQKWAGLKFINNLPKKLSHTL
jgi:hypothetical protein